MEQATDVRMTSLTFRTGQIKNYCARAHPTGLCVVRESHLTQWRWSTWLKRRPVPVPSLTFVLEEEMSPCEQLRGLVCSENETGSWANIANTPRAHTHTNNHPASHAYFLSAMFSFGNNRLIAILDCFVTMQFKKHPLISWVYFMYPPGKKPIENV